ncbi:hypothetical protein OBBRIDRAFT_738596, partial [Obba rivulosa]
MVELRDDGGELVEWLVNETETSELAKSWAIATVKRLCKNELTALAHKNTGLHFNATKASEEQLQEFETELLAETMQTRAPVAWELFGALLEANTTLANRRRKRKHKPCQRATRQASPHSSQPAETGDADVEMPPAAQNSHKDQGRCKKEHVRKSVLCMSIMLQSTNQRYNALQTMVGIFLHACSAPKAVIDLLSRLGLSISRSAINYAINHLSADSARQIEKLGRTLLSQKAYDNFDVELKHLVPTVEKPHDTLLHLTSGMLIKLEHGVVLDDLCCSDELWLNSIHNPSNIRRTDTMDWFRLVGDIHAEAQLSSGLTRRQHFHEWKFLIDLVVDGPEYFRQFRADLKEPEAVEKIPVVQSTQIPVMAMDINESTTAGNADVLTNLFKQAGIGSKNEDG